MSFAIDANILLYASDSNSPFHAKAKEFVTRCAEEDKVFYLAWLTVMSYLRIATHPRIFAAPLTMAQAKSNITSLLELRHCQTIGETDTFWSAYESLTNQVPTRGNLVPDVHLAAVLKANGIGAIYTHDRDFHKFPQLSVHDPVG